MDALLLFPTRDRAFSAGSSSSWLSSSSSLAGSSTDPFSSASALTHPGNALRASFSLGTRRGSAGSALSPAAPPEITLQLAQNPVFLYPVSSDSNSFLPEVLEAEQALQAGSSRAGEDDTVLQGEAAFTLHEATHVGGIKLVWEVATQRRRDSFSEWRPRKVIQTIELEEEAIGSVLEAGKHEHKFQINLPAQLPPTMCNSFERVTHTLYASLLNVSPAYQPSSDELPPAYAESGSPPASTPAEAPSPELSPYPSRSSPVPLTRTLSDESTTSLDEGSPPRTGRGGILKAFFSGRSRKDKVGPSPVPTFAVQADQAGRARSLSLKSESTRTGEKTTSDEDLPQCCRPSLAHVAQTVAVLASHDVRGEVRRLNWTRDTLITGLGQLASAITSDLFVLGGNLNVSLRLTGMPQTAIIYAISLNLIQRTTAPDGKSTEVDEYALYHRGVPFQMFDITPSRERHQLWRGEEVRRSAAAPKRSRAYSGSGAAAVQPTPQCKTPGITTTESGLSLVASARLPSPVIAALASSPPESLLGQGGSRGSSCGAGIKTKTTHRLRLEVYFSIRGEDAWGNPLAVTHGPDGRPREGEVRRFWIDRAVKVGSCLALGANLVAPTYAEDTPDARQAALEHKFASIGEADVLPSARVPMRAWKEEKSPDGGQAKSAFRRIPGDIYARRKAHSTDTHGACACFLREAEVRKQAGTAVDLDSMAQAEVWRTKAGQ